MSRLLSAKHSRKLWRIAGATTLLLAAASFAATVALAAGGSGRAKAAAANKTFVLAVPSVPGSLDTNPYSGNSTRALYYILDSTLLKVSDANLKGNGCQQLAALNSVAPNLATSWRVSRNRKSITLHLSNAKSAAGNTLNAQDVVWSFQRALAVTTNVIPQITQISHWNTKNLITSSGPHTVTIHISQPTPYDLTNLTHFLLPVWDYAAIKPHITASDPWATQWLNTNTADFGPWQLESFQPGDEIVFKRNPYYAGQTGNIGTLIIKAVPDPSTSLELLKTGQVDWAEGLSYSQMASLKHTSGVTVQTCMSPDRDELVLQQQNPKFRNVRVRQAISMALHRAQLVKGAYFGFGKPAVSGISQYYNISPQPAQYTESVSKAKKLLARAGYRHGFSMTLLYSTSRPGPQAAPDAVLIKSMLAKIGIRVTLQQSSDPTTFFTAFLKGNYDAVLWAEEPAFADGAYSVLGFNNPLSTNDSFHFKSRAYVKALAKADSLPLGAKRDKAVSKLGTLGVTQLPVIYLVDDVYVNAYRSGITGYQALPDGDLSPQTLTVH